MSSLKYLSSQRGNNKILVCDDFLYNFVKTENTITFWRCRSRKCPGRVKIAQDNTVTMFKTHNHSEIEKKVINAMEATIGIKEGP